MVHTFVAARRVGNALVAKRKLMCIASFILSTALFGATLFCGYNSGVTGDPLAAPAVSGNRAAAKGVEAQSEMASRLVSMITRGANTKGLWTNVVEFSKGMLAAPLTPYWAMALLLFALTSSRWSALLGLSLLLVFVGQVGVSFLGDFPSTYQIGPRYMFPALISAVLLLVSALRTGAANMVSGKPLRYVHSAAFLLLVGSGLVYGLDRSGDLLERYGKKNLEMSAEWIDLSNAVEEGGISNAIVFMTPRGAISQINCVNSPHLDDDVLFATYATPTCREGIRKLFPKRALFHWDGKVLHPIASDMAGLVVKWYLLGPFSLKSEKKDIQTLDSLLLQAAMSFATPQLAEWPWSKHVSHLGYVNVYGRPDQALCYAYCEVYAEQKGVYSVGFDATQNCTLYVNGTVVAQGGSPFVQPDALQVSTELNQGWNSLLVKVTSKRGDMGFYLRMRDAEGRPLAQERYRIPGEQAGGPSSQ
jgi:hypothetical protein